MGGDSSKSDIGGGGRAGRRKSGDDINAVFLAHSGTQKVMSKDDFINIFTDSPEVGELMFSYICRLRGSFGSGLSSSDYAAGVRSIVDRGGETNLMDFYFSVFSQEDTFTQNDVQNILRICCDADWSTLSGRKSSSNDPLFVLLAKSAVGANSAINSMRFRTWCMSNCPMLFSGMHSIVLAHLTGHHGADSASQMFGRNDVVKNCESKRSIASITTMWYLSCLLDIRFTPDSSHSDAAATMTRLMKVADSDGWHIVYDSGSQGLSVNRFEHHVMDYKGPTLLFIAFQDFVFLLAVDCPWKESGQRWGGDGCVFVQLMPEYKISRSGAGLIFFNLSDRTLPKGISVGKDRTTILSINGELEKVNYLGVDYSIRALEIWGCGGATARENQLKQKAWEQRAVSKEQNRKLVPEDWKDSVDRDLLEMGGVKTRHSERQDV